MISVIQRGGGDGARTRLPARAGGRTCPGRRPADPAAAAGRSSPAAAGRTAPRRRGSRAGGCPYGFGSRRRLAVGGCCGAGLRAAGRTGSPAPGLAVGVLRRRAAGVVLADLLISSCRGPSAVWRPGTSRCSATAAPRAGAAGRPSRGREDPGDASSGDASDPARHNSPTTPAETTRPIAAQRRRWNASTANRPDATDQSRQTIAVAQEADRRVPSETPWSASGGVLAVHLGEQAVGVGHQHRRRTTGTSAPRTRSTPT